MAVGALPPGIELQLPPGEGQRPVDLAPLLVGRCQSGQRLHRQAVQVLLLQQQPLLELGAAGQRKALQEPAAVQGHRLFQTCQVSET